MALIEFENVYIRDNDRNSTKNLPDHKISINFRLDWSSLNSI